MYSVTRLSLTYSTAQNPSPMSCQASYLSSTFRYDAFDCFPPHSAPSLLECERAQSSQNGIRKTQVGRTRHQPVRRNMQHGTVSAAHFRGPQDARRRPRKCEMMEKPRDWPRSMGQPVSFKGFSFSHRRIADRIGIAVRIGIVAHRRTRSSRRTTGNRRYSRRRGSLCRCSWIAWWNSW